MSGDDDDDVDRSLVQWLGTLNINISSIDDAGDGTVIAKALATISSTSFNTIDISSSSNPVVVASNHRQILRHIIDYYEHHLEKHIDTSHIDIDAIVGKGDSSHHYRSVVVSMMELVVGVAVMCDDKATFIQNIFSLDINSQRVLKALIEQVMSRVQPISVAIKGSKGNDDDDDGVLRANEMIRHLQEERHDLIDKHHHLELKVHALEEEKHDLCSKLADYQKEIEALHLSSISTSTVNSINNDISAELEDTKRELDVLQVTLDSLKADYSNEKKTIQALKDIQAKNETEMQQMQDELDLARGHASKLAKIEVENDKLKKRLEEVSSLKKENVELNKTLDSYLDKIRDFEIASKNYDNLQKMIDQYKDKVIEGETKSFELMSSNEILTKELDNERKERSDERKRFSDERHHLQSQIEEYKLIVTEKDEKAMLDISVSEANSNSSIVAEEMSLLTQQVQELSKSKKRLETASVEDKRVISDLKQEIAKLNEQINISVERSDASSVKDNSLEQKLATIQLLENKLKEKENRLIRLEQDKSKLHSFYEQSFTSFKEKHLQMIYDLKTICKNEKRRNDELKDKYDKSRDQHIKESRLLTSSFFELGGMIFNRNIEMKISEQQATYLGKVRNETIQRRQEVERQLSQTTNPATPQFR